MEKIIVTIKGILSILGIYWFFLVKRGNSPDQQRSTIIVDGAINPNLLKFPQDKTTNYFSS